MIDFKSIVKMSIVSLKIHKMRSALTSLGIIIGVSAVIIMLAVGTGAAVTGIGIMAHAAPTFPFQTSCASWAHTAPSGFTVWPQSKQLTRNFS